MCLIYIYIYNILLFALNTENLAKSLCWRAAHGTFRRCSSFTTFKKARADNDDPVPPHLSSAHAPHSKEALVTAHETRFSSVTAWAVAAATAQLGTAVLFPVPSILCTHCVNWQCIVNLNFLSRRKTEYDIVKENQLTANRPRHVFINQFLLCSTIWVIATETVQCSHQWELKQANNGAALQTD